MCGEVKMSRHTATIMSDKRKLRLVIRIYRPRCVKKGSHLKLLFQFTHKRQEKEGLVTLDADFPPKRRTEDNASLYPGTSPYPTANYQKPSGVNCTSYYFPKYLTRLRVTPNPP
ncbi:hypothetical protein STEG23_021902 [Scotinomys teguina]